ncbi:MAG: hypothetical protein ACFFCE_11515 [Promethearchaeota archaeon]
MELLNKSFEEIKRVKNPEIINDFLIKLSEDPDEDYLIYINYLIDNLDKQILNKVNLNLIFFIGEIGKIVILNDRYLTFLIETYYTSDRWIRNEIIQTIGKISQKTEISDDIIKLVINAVNDDYHSIKSNALQVILNLKEIPLNKSEFIFRILNLKNKELEKLCIQIIEKFLPDYTQLINSLSYSENYKILKPFAIRTLLLVYFRSVINIESFREKISNSNWEMEYKEIYVKEIDTFEKVILKNL